MSNVMYLVCAYHPDRVNSFRLAQRSYPLSCYITSVSARKLDSRLNDWLEKHALCGGGRDHFTIAFDLTKDHDLPKIQPVANGVHLALEKGAAIAQDAANLIEFNEGRMDS